MSRRIAKVQQLKFITWGIQHAAAPTSLSSLFLTERASCVAICVVNVKQRNRMSNTVRQPSPEARSPELKARSTRQILPCHIPADEGLESAGRGRPRKQPECQMPQRTPDFAKRTEQRGSRTPRSTSTSGLIGKRTGRAPGRDVGTLKVPGLFA